MVSVGVVAAVVHALAERNRDSSPGSRPRRRVDKLTGVLNRRGFDERGAVELERARREGTPVAVVSLDIDYFKRVNDEWGHEVGDRVLVRLGAVLHARRRALRRRRAAGRRGVRDPAARHGRRPRRRPSPSGCGPASRPTTGAAARDGQRGRDRRRSAPASIEELLQVADSALYAAKQRRVATARSVSDQALASTSPVKNSMSAA